MANFKLVKMVKSKLSVSLAIITVIPIVLMGIILAFLGINAVNSTARDDSEEMLTGVCKQVRQDFIAMYPGDLTISNGVYYAGGVDVADFISVLEDYKTNFGVECTVFFDDVRAVTTIKNNVNQYVIGTEQRDKKILYEIKAGRNYYAPKVMIDGKQYNGEYIPIYDGGAFSGMIFAGITSKDFSARTSVFYITIVIVTLVMVVAVSIISTRYSKKISKLLKQIMDYLGLLVQKQTPDVAMADAVIAREDEIGNLGRYAVEAGNKLKTIIGRDALTGLYNRRTGRQFLEMLWDAARADFAPIAIVMCDIDFFKNVNDQFGHDMGDIVLKKVGDILSSNVEDTESSFAIRWGGEEFLLGFLLNGPQAMRAVSLIRSEIKDHKFLTENGDEIAITMTFGVVTASASEEIASVISRADAKLYEGKESGRDRIVGENDIIRD